MKIKRHSKIIELVNNCEIETQEELAQMLADSGYNVTQATVSRDIRELKLTKIQGERGIQKYSVLPAVNKQFNERFLRVFSDGVISINYAQNMIVIKTLDGMAMAVASCIDSMNDTEVLSSEIMGTIAGDDCIFCVLKSEEKAIEAINKLREVIKGRIE